MGTYPVGTVSDAAVWHPHRDSLWKHLVLETDDVNTQWRQVLALMNTDVIYALAPQEKEKIERPYRWLQDRIIRTFALEHMTSRFIRPPGKSRSCVLKKRRTNTLPLSSLCYPQPLFFPKDVFCLRHTRTADGYRKISIAGHALQIPGIEPRGDVDVHLIPDQSKNLVEIRI